MENIKILITYKERHKLLKSKILTPVQSGRAIADEVFEEMLGDDTGDNISDKNSLYSELSAFYWAWKNYDKIGNPEYIGFMHYRRLFLFDNINNSEVFINRQYSSFYPYPSIDEQLVSYFSDNKIKKIVPQYDYLIPDWHYTPTENIRLEYIYNIPGSESFIFDTFIEICKQKLPDYKEEIKDIEFGNKVMVCNMFIMKKDLFFKYCEFAFPILEELEKSIDTTSLSKNGLRFLGYMAEKLQTIFILHLQKDKSLKYQYLNCAYVINPDNISTKLLYIKAFWYKNMSSLFPKNDYYRRKKELYTDIKRYNRNRKRLE